MGRISTYMQVSLDGYFAGPNGEIDWFKNTEPDPGFDAYSLERAQGDSVLLFGHTTYDMMSSAWQSDEAHEDQPGMADVMAKSPKIVFSKSLMPANAFFPLPDREELELVEERSFKNGLAWLTYQRTDGR